MGFGEYRWKKADFNTDARGATSRRGELEAQDAAFKTKQLRHPSNRVELGSGIEESAHTFLVPRLNTSSNIEYSETNFERSTNLLQTRLKHQSQHDLKKPELSSMDKQSRSLKHQMASSMLAT